MRQQFKLSTSHQYTNQTHLQIQRIKISNRIQSAKSQYNKQRQLKHSSQFERYNKNISQNTRRSSHYNFKQLLFSTSFEYKLKKPFQRSSYISNQKKHSGPNPYYSENHLVYF